LEIGSFKISKLTKQYMKKPFIYSTIILILLVCSVFQANAQKYDNPISSDYPIQPVPFTSIKVSDQFWMPKIKKIHDVTIPHALAQSENRLMNFKIAAKLKKGRFQSSYPFDDSDIYKIIEAASYSLYYNPDSLLEGKIDTIIDIIGLAQEPDGYLYTCRTMNSFPNEWAGTQRWENEEILSHETYNLGHLFESACAYYQATGKDKYLKIAIKAADLLDADFGWGKIEKYPGHEIVEVGLARLYRLTGDEKYLNLAKFFLDVRGPGGEEYCQAQAKVVDQTNAVGHAVRAVYLYAGMADVAALKNDPSYISAIDKIWEDIVTKKIYVTGGIGASGGNEGFNGDYNLPNSNAYCETCASVGNIYFNQRLFLLHGDAKYIDVMERTLYNALLSGISLSGNRFFYPNRLSSTGSDNRSVWFDCACCPPNIARLIPSVPGYIYAHTHDSLYINLFMSDTANVNIDGNNLQVIQNTNYPWDGNVDITINPSLEREYSILVRIPGWARNEAIPGGLYQFMGKSSKQASISINNESFAFDIQKGYAVIKRNWKAGDVISLNLPMEPRRLAANENVIDDKNRVSIQRGPIVYCAEGVDNSQKVISLKYDTLSVLKTHFDGNILGGLQIVQTNSVTVDGNSDKDITLIPYSTWNNRGASEMQVWLKLNQRIDVPDSLILIDVIGGDSSSTNYVSTWETLNSIYDLYDPLNSADKGEGAFGNWASDQSTVGVWNWVQYKFHKEFKIGSSEVYWWKDNEGIDIPDSTYLSYYNSTSKAFVSIKNTLKNKDDGGIAYDKYNLDIFAPVTTNQIRLNFFGKRSAQGILEWKVYSTKRTLNSSQLTKPVKCRIYPNSSDNEMIVESNSDENAHLSIYTMEGKLIYQSSFIGKTILRKSEVGNGIFIARISVEGYVENLKIIFK
jgi:uncharacterized protein